MAVDKNFYNEASAAKLGWEPHWFAKGLTEFDYKLVKAIKVFQKSHRLTADGLCGPTTFRRLYAALEEQKQHARFQLNNSSPVLYCKDMEIPICWDKVVTFKDPGSLKLTGGRARWTKKRPIKMFVNHWDVCLSSESCVRVLNKRNISVHFCIDNDGTIYQLMDLNDAAWHAGGRGWNNSSIGVEIANAYYLKYQNWYKRHGYGERPIVENETCHGNSMKPFTGFYPVQIQALQALWTACHKGLGIPLQTPLDDDGNTLKQVSYSAARNRFSGFVSHYHLTKRKIDCAGLDIEQLLNDLR